MFSKNPLVSLLVVIAVAVGVTIVLALVLPHFKVPYRSSPEYAISTADGVATVVAISEGEITLGMKDAVVTRLVGGTRIYFSLLIPASSDIEVGNSVTILASRRSALSIDGEPVTVFIAEKAEN